MPIEKDELQEVFADMKTLFEENPDKAIKSQAFIRKLHDYCIYELKRQGLKTEISKRGIGKTHKNKITIKDELMVYGSHKPKNVDVGIVHDEAGPLISISIRSQMSSIMKNFPNYYEGHIGDCISTHDKYPALVYGLIYLLPKKIFRKDKEGNTRKENYKLQDIENKFEKIANRKDEYDVKHKYEHIALLIVDFEKNPPEIVDFIPHSRSDLRIESFFDKLVKTYKDRNMDLEIF